MPQPTDPLKPNDLAKQIAERLATNEPTKKPRFSFKSSIVVGGIINGLVILTVGAVVVAGIFVGVNWLLSFDEDDGGTATATDDAKPSADPALLLIPGGLTTIPVEDEIGVVGASSTTTTQGGPFISPTTTQPGPFVTFPPSTTTTTTTMTSPPPTTNPSTTVTPTTQPSTTQATTTTSSSTSSTTTSTSTTSSTSTTTSTTSSTPTSTSVPPTTAP